MKRLLFATILCLPMLLAAPTSMAADAGAKVDAKAAVTVPAATTAPATKAPVAPAADTKPAVEPKPAAPTAAPELSWWKVGLANLMKLGFLLLTLMATAFVRVLMKKYGFEEQTAKVDDVLKKAAGFAEQWAIKKVKLDGEAAPGGAKKMEMAVDFAKKLAVEYKIKDKGSDWWEHKLESWLGAEKARSSVAVLSTSESTEAPPA